MAEQLALGFGGLLRQLRAQAGLTQEELAEAAGLSSRSVSDLERGIHPTARKDTAELLAGALGLAGPARPLFVAAARGRAPAAEVLAALDGEAVAAGVCPFKGLAFFDRADAEFFCGRERLTADVLARLVESPLAGIVGSSGVGKSSLLRAGVLPELGAGSLPGSERWRQVLLRPGTHPGAELSRALGGEAPGRALGRLEPGERIVIAVDQLEELFTLCEQESERAAFAGQLAAAVRDAERRALVVVVLRADFYGRLASYPPLAALVSASHVLVGPMDRGELARAIEQPAARAGLEAERPLVEALISEVAGEPGGLPLLSTTLLELWRSRDGRVLRYGSYRAGGGVRGAVARLAEDAYHQLGDAQRPIARGLMLRLASGEDGTLARRRVPLGELERVPGAGPVLAELIGARLLTVSDGEVELSHEALLREWPRYRAWLEEDRIGRRLHAHLTAAVSDWDERNRDRGELYRGARLASALDWAAGHPGELNPAEREFLEASRAAADRELREQRERADREAQARLREARARRRLRAVLACVFALLLLSATVGAVALQQRGQARAAERSAEAAQRSAAARRLGALALSEPDLDRSLLLAAAAVRTYPSLETKGDLLSALLRSPHALAQVRGDGHLQDLALSPDGRVLAADDNDGRVILWDARTMRRIGTPLHAGDWAGWEAFSPDSRRLAVEVGTDSGAQAVVVDLATRRVLLTLAAPPGDAGPGKLTWTRDGRIVAVGTGTGRLIFYDTATGRKKGRVGVPGAGTSRNVDAYPAGDKVLAIAEGTRDAVLVDPRTARIVRRIVLPVPASVAGVSRDGRSVAVGDAKGDVVIDDVKTGSVLRRNGAHASVVTNLVFSPGGRTAASLSDDQKVIVWDVKTGKPRLTLQGHTGSILGGAFAPDGRTLYTDGLDSSVIKWDVSGGRSFGVTTPSFQRIQLKPGLGGWGYYAGWSADRRRAVLGYESGLIATIDTATGRLVARDTPIKKIADLALSPDGRFAYIVSADGTLRRWDIAARRFDKVITLGTPQPEGTVPEGMVSVSPDGRTLAVSTQLDNGVYVIDASTFRRIAGPVGPGFTGVSVFSPNGQMLALAPNNNGPGLALLDIPSGRVRWENRSLTDALSLAFSPDGRRLVASSSEGTIATFDTQSGRRLAGPRVAHPEFVHAVAFSPDGRTILSGGDDGTVRLWDAAGLRPLGGPLRVSDNAGAFATFSVDGASILALDVTSRITTWDATPAKWLARACSIVGRRDFTPEERTVFSITPENLRPCP
jgi:WD40 repeat protein/transcriptional regulator with XRE-family HTH domain